MSKCTKHPESPSLIKVLHFSTVVIGQYICGTYCLACIKVNQRIDAVIWTSAYLKKSVR